MSLPLHEMVHKSQLFSTYSHDTHDRLERISYPLEDVTETITERFRDLHKGDAITTLVDGAFDVPHPNHEWYLRHCRLLGAATLLHCDETEMTPDNLAAALESSHLKLAVTVDADHKVNYKKGKQAEKGGVERPIYPWTARAERVAGYIFKTASGLYRPVVDLVTVEGDATHTNTALESSLTLARHLANEALLESLIIYGEHDVTISEAISMGLTPLIIPSGQEYTTNPQTGQDWSSSGLINRAQGAIVPHPVTQPNQYS